MTGSLFALVLSVGMTNGTYQEVVLGVYDNQQQCEIAAVEQHVFGECYPVDAVIPADEIPTSRQF